MSKQLRIGISDPITINGTHYEAGSKGGYADLSFRIYSADLGFVLESLKRAMATKQGIYLTPEQHDNLDPAFVAWFREGDGDE